MVEIEPSAGGFLTPRSISARFSAMSSAAKCDNILRAGAEALSSLTPEVCSNFWACLVCGFLPVWHMESSSGEKLDKG